MKDIIRRAYLDKNNDCRVGLETEREIQTSKKKKWGRSLGEICNHDDEDLSNVAIKQTKSQSGIMSPRECSCQR